MKLQWCSTHVFSNDNKIMSVVMILGVVSGMDEIIFVTNYITFVETLNLYDSPLLPDKNYSILTKIKK